MRLQLRDPGLARFRVNAFNQNRGAGAVFAISGTLEDLGAPKIFRELIAQPQGLILVTGPTGSGKSTTLAAMLDHVSKNEYAHILSVEDPDRVRAHPQKRLINQREVHRDTQLQTRALRAACARTRTTSWSARCATSKPSVWRSPRPKPDTSVFATCTPPRRPNGRPHHRRVPGRREADGAPMLSESLRAVISQSLLKKSSAVGALPRTKSWSTRHPRHPQPDPETRWRRCTQPSRPARNTGMQTLDQACSIWSSAAW